MNKTARTLLALAVTTCALAAAPSARAFCGFYVSGADAPMFANATHVVLMREGSRTVLAMQNEYQGPAEDFALVIPVPVVLQKENVKTLAREVFESVDKMSAPRLVEYWEQDPCAPANDFARGGLGLSGVGEGGGGRGEGIGLGSVVTVEAKFTVGEYDIVILSAKDSSGLDAWLRQENYKIPAGAAEALKPYVTAGMKFFVAKVNAKKVKFENGHTVLSPLRFHYDSETFTLPVKLGLLNSQGAQDLIVNIVSPEGRFEAANLPNATIPTNVDVPDDTRKTFGAFYTQLLNKTFAEHPRAAVTEYAWSAQTCDPCPGPTLSQNDLATLGGDVLPSARPGPSGVASAVRVENVAATGGLTQEVSQRILRQGLSRMRSCITSARGSTDAKAGTASVALTVAKDGSIPSTSVSTTTLEPSARACIETQLKATSFPSPEGGGTASVTANYTVAQNSSVESMIPRSGMTLTRLHMRYDKSSLGADLVFRAAAGIAGGREEFGQATQSGDAKPSSLNQFQGRYIIRHPWAGAVACATPKRGVWLDAPNGQYRGSRNVLATSTMFGSGGAGLASIGAQAGDAGAVPAPNVIPTAAPTSTAGATASAAPSSAASAQPAKSGCSASRQSSSRAGVSSLIALVAALVGMRRCAKPRARNTSGAQGLETAL